MIIKLLIGILAVYLAIKFFNRDTASNTSPPSSTHEKTAPEISEDYFRMRMDLYLKRHFASMLGWEFIDKDEIHYLKPVTRVMLHLPEGGHPVSVPTVSVWNDRMQRTDHEETDGAADKTSKEDNIHSDITDWILKNINGIQQSIDDAKRLGMVYTEYPIRGSKEFIGAVKDHLLHTTEYDITCGDQKLIINFQACDF